MFAQPTRGQTTWQVRDCHTHLPVASRAQTYGATMGAAAPLVSAAGALVPAGQTMVFAGGMVPQSAAVHVLSGLHMQVWQPLSSLR